MGWWNLRLPLQWCTYYIGVGQLPDRAYNKPHPCCCFIPSNSSKVWGTKKPPSSFAVHTCDHYGEYLHGATSQWPIPIMKVAGTKKQVTGHKCRSLFYPSVITQITCTFDLTCDLDFVTAVM